MAMSLQAPQQTAPASRRWRIWIPGPDVNDVPVDASGPAAWVKGGHLFVGVFETQQWTHAWAPGGWLSCELMAAGDQGRVGRDPDPAG